MCGIVGFYSKKQFDNEVIITMGNSISHRGPDASGYWTDGSNRFKLCHRRLSILDLSFNGAQPMISQSSRWVISFNGEIYNFPIIKRMLEDDYGTINFKGTSDTEVILFAFENWGIDKTIEIMNGMFAIVLWDDLNKKIYLIRDRAGEKPLYYGIINGVFFFGSELKAFSAHPLFEKKINPIAARSFFQYNYVPSSLCIYEKMNKVLPGTYIEFNTNDFSSTSKVYWNIRNKIDIIQSNHKKNIEVNYVEELHKLLKSKVSSQLVSDVPIGAFLSGGIDSSTIVAIMQDVSNCNIKTFSIGFQNEQYNEAKYAKEVAKHLKTDHTELYLSNSDVISTIPLLSQIYDEPFSDSSQIPTFLVSKLAKSDVTVCLSGDGGDELFSGYNRYALTDQFWSIIKYLPVSSRDYIGKILLNKSSERWNNIFVKLNPYLPTKFHLNNYGDKIHKIAKFIDSSDEYDLYNRFISNPLPKDLFNDVDNYFEYNFDNLSRLSFIEKMMVSDFEMYLPDDILVKVDRASMANSLETRVPFLDHEIIEFAWKIPFNFKIRNGQGKWIIRQILKQYVPEKLFVRPKMGFGIPIGDLLNGSLQNWADEMLSREQLSKHNILNFNTVSKMWNDHKSKKKNWQYALWSILMFQSWYNDNFS